MQGYLMDRASAICRERSIGRSNERRRTLIHKDGHRPRECILLTQFGLSHATHMQITTVNIIVSARRQIANYIFLN